MAKPKRVLLTLQALDMSGVAFSAQNLATGLTGQGAQVMVLARAGGQREKDFEASGARVAFSKHFGLPLLGRPSLSLVRRFDPQIIHAQSVNILPRTRALAHALGAPLVATANRLDDSERAPLATWPEVNVVAVSDAIQERLINRGGVSRDRIRVIPNGLDLSQFPRPALEEETGPDHLPVVGTYGTLAEHKGQRVFLRAAAKVLAQGLDAEFLIMGHGPDKPTLRHMANDLGITNRVTFSPNTTSDRRSLASMDVFVEPTFQEGLGLSVLQAMAAGVPVIASGVGGIYSLVQDGETGLLVPSGDAEALAQGICGLLAEPKRRLEMARHARERVEQAFSIDRVVERLVDFYSTLSTAAAAS